MGLSCITLQRWWASPVRQANPEPFKEKAMRKIDARSRVALATFLLSALIGLLAAGSAAAAPFAYPANWKAGFVMDPVLKPRVGYVTDFSGSRDYAAKGCPGL